MARARFTDADRDRKEKRLQDRVVQRYKPELDLLRAHQAASKRTTPRFRGPNKEGNIERHSKNRGAPLLHAQQTVRARRSLTAHAANREVRAAKKPVKSNALNKLRISLKR
ncbi:MAG: hypothetical protein COB04_16215 [Gammaproteobacteria bacterium]|nr:MAG: hypothetical protein COB04_16215 [Gammaproteobacteria bacterium]